MLSFQVNPKLLKQRIFGFLAVRDCSGADRSYAESQNTVGEVLSLLSVDQNVLPMTAEPLPCFVPTADIVTGLGTVGASVSDLVGLIQPTWGFNPYNDGVCPKFFGFILSQRFTANASTAAYTLKVRYIARINGVYGIISDLNHDIVIEPASGANSALEMMVFTMGPSLRMVNDTATRTLNTVQTQKNGYITPIHMVRDAGAEFIVGAPPPDAVANTWAIGQEPATVLDTFSDGIVGVAVVLTNQAGVSQYASVTPLFSTQDLPYIFHDALDAKLSNALAKSKA